MTDRLQDGPDWNIGLGLYCQMWQSQIEHSMKLCAFWAQMMPHRSAADYAKLAESYRVEPSNAAPSAQPGAAAPLDTAKDAVNDDAAETRFVLTDAGAKLAPEAARPVNA